jgi:hypothetical protein
VTSTYGYNGRGMLVNQQNRKPGSGSAAYLTDYQGDGYPLLDMAYDPAGNLQRLKAVNTATGAFPGVSLAALH